MSIDATIHGIRGGGEITSYRLDVRYPISKTSAEIEADIQCTIGRAPTAVRNDARHRWLVWFFPTSSERLAAMSRLQGIIDTAWLVDG